MQSRVFKIDQVLVMPTADNTAALTFADALSAQEVRVRALVGCRYVTARKFQTMRYQN